MKQSWADEGPAVTTRTLSDKRYQRVRIVDSHTGGEPTRIVIDGAPALTGSMSEQLRQFRELHDYFRSAVINEPRGSDVLVGGLLTPATSAGAAAGVIYFNNVGFLGMCGHGTIGLIATLAHLKRIPPGDHLLDTPVGPVRVRLHASGEVTVYNVPSYRHERQRAVDVPGLGLVHGDIAWGGNWFFICEDHGLTLTRENIPQLLLASQAIAQALHLSGIGGADGGLIDHVELCGPSTAADSRNFVLCPGGAYDRSPCGTGTSAKVACLASDGLLEPGETWRQESIIGSVFTAGYERSGDRGGARIQPAITGRAYITGESTLLLDPEDPFVHGIAG